MSSPVTEVVVYTVKPDVLEQFLQQQPVAHAAVSTFPGFRSLRTLRSESEPPTFVDYCEWESLAHAKQANELAMQTPELSIFFELGDGIISFGHYTTVTYTGPKH